AVPGIFPTCQIEGELIMPTTPRPRTPRVATVSSAASRPAKPPVRVARPAGISATATAPSIGPRDLSVRLKTLSHKTPAAAAKELKALRVTPAEFAPVFREVAKQNPA